MGTPEDDDTMMQESMKLTATAVTTTESKPVGFGGCVTHQFPAESDRCVVVRLRGFEQNPESCQSSCGWVWQASFPGGDELAELLPPALAAKMSQWVRDDMSDRLNRHCRRFVTGGRLHTLIFGLIFMMMLLMSIARVALPAENHKPDGEKTDHSGIIGPNLLFYPGLPLAFILPLLAFTLWTVCVRNPEVDKAITAECQALTDESHGVYVVQFTTWIASCDGKKEPSKQLKYITLRLADGADAVRGPDWCIRSRRRI